MCLKSLCSQIYSWIIMIIPIRSSNKLCLLHHVTLVDTSHVFIVHLLSSHSKCLNWMGWFIKKQTSAQSFKLKSFKYRLRVRSSAHFFYNFVHGTLPFNQYFDESLVGNLSYLICILWSREMGLPQSTKSAPFNRYLFGTNSSLLLVDTKSKSILET